MANQNLSKIGRDLLQVVEKPIVECLLSHLETRALAENPENTAIKLSSMGDFVAEMLRQSKELNRFLIMVQEIITTRKVTYLQSLECIVQRSERWFERRSNMLTASSDVACILGEAKYGGSEKSVIKKKTFTGPPPEFKGNKFTSHGVKYEDVALRVYETRHDTHIMEFGLIPHRTIKHLGASPDGIMANGRMIEVKVPYSRIPDGNVPMGYFIQMQTQMEVCDLDVCDFFECIIKEYNGRKEYDSDAYNPGTVKTVNTLPEYPASFINVPNDRRTSEGLEKGLVGRVGAFPTGTFNTYYYPPMQMDTDEQFDWLMKKRLAISSTTGLSMSIDYWRIEATSLNPVNRDESWWKGHDVTKRLAVTWNKIIAFRDAH